MRLSFLFLLIGLNASSQYFLPVARDSVSPLFEIVTYGVADFGATSIQNDLSGKFLFGGAITEEIKNASFDKHKSLNRLGADVQAELEFRNYKSSLFGKERLGWLLKGGTYLNAGAVYSDDLFGLAFYGNERYLGETVSFGGTRGSVWSFRKIGFGLLDKKTGSSVSLNAYGVASANAADLSVGELYQSADGDSVYVNYDGFSENLINKGLFSGWGFGFDVDLRIPVMGYNGNEATIQFLVKNAGLMFLPEVQRYSADSSFSFTGFTLDQLINSTNLFNSTSDLSDTLGINADTVSAVRFAPAFLQVGKMVDEYSSKKMQFFYGARMYPSLVLVPQIYIGLDYRPTKWIALGVNGAYGGYTGFRSGLYTDLKLKKMNIGIASENLIGTMLNTGMGRSLLFRLNWRI
jgi:hypothetical protein